MFLKCFFQRDIIELAAIKDLDGFRSLLGCVASSVGSTCDYSNFSRTAGLSFVTAKKYLFSFEQSYILFKIHPYMKSTAKRYIKSPKWYFCDNGFLQIFHHGLSEGALLENFVISEMRKRLLILGNDASAMYFSQTQSGAEVDLIIELNNHDKLAFEIKSSKTLQRSDFRNLRELLRVDHSISRGYVFYLGDKVEVLDQKVVAVPVGWLYGRL